VGIEVVLEKEQDQQQNCDNDAQKTISETGKIGMARSEPHKSKSPRPLAVMLFLRPKEGLVTNNCRMFHRKSTPMQHDPYILCGLFLTLLASRFTIRAYLLLRSYAEGKFERCGHWGKHDAILAGLDCAVHQSGMLRARTLVAGVSFRSQRWAGILPQLRKFAASSTAADRAAPSHEAAFADCSPPAAQAAIDFSVGVAPS
jgi:hypothetical protein